MVACSSKVSFVGRYAEAIDLGVRVLNGTRANSRQGLPESVGSVVLAAGESNLFYQVAGEDRPNCMVITS